MSSAQQRRDTVLPPLLVCALMFLDPRRWVGAVMAVCGILVSIVAPFFPKFLLDSVFSEPGAAEILRVSIPRRPQSLFPPNSRPSRIRPLPRPQTMGDSPLLPHVFSPDRHPHFTASSVLPESSHSISLTLDSSPSHLDSRLSSFPPSPSSSTPSLPPASPMPYIHPLALPSLDSLDLATDADTLTDSKPPASPNLIRHFRVHMPKLGFRKRLSTTDLRNLKSAEASNVTVLAALPRDITASPQNYPSSDVEWQGTGAFAVRRHSVKSTSTLPPSDKTTGLSAPRRRFSLFSREPSSTWLGKTQDEVDSRPVTPPSHSVHPSSTTIPPVPEPQSPPVLKSMVASLPLSVVAGPSHSRVVSSPMSNVHSEDMIPFEQTSAPPVRPSRTDPYKTYGVPVPGSDRARAFLKAERERIRAERERKDRDRAVSGQGVQQEAKVESGERSRRRHSGKQVGMEQVEQQEKKVSPGYSKKGKGPAPALGLDPGNEADAEDEKQVMQKGMEQFGVLPSLNATSASPQAQPPVRPSSSQGKRGWIFTRRSSEATGEMGEKQREKKMKAKEKPVKEKPISKDSRPKSRDSSHGGGFGFRSKDTPRNKDRGYSSDAGVPSLTYKLMYESSSLQGAAPR